MVPIVTFKQRENHPRKSDVSKLKPATLLKIKRFSCFLNCTTNGTETRRASHTVEYTLERLDCIIYNPLFQQRHCNIVVLEKEVRVPKKLANSEFIISSDTIGSWKFQKTLLIWLFIWNFYHKH